MGGVCLGGFHLITKMDPFYLQSEIEFDGDIFLGNCSPACPLRSRSRWRRSRASPSPPPPPAKRIIPQYLLLPIFSVCLLQSFNLDPPLAEVLIRNLQSNFIPLLMIQSVKKYNRNEFFKVNNTEYLSNQGRNSPPCI